MKRRINIDEAMMSSLGLVSEYANVDTERINKVASDVRGTTIEKYAGIFINNPTQENIEDFIRKYMYNELTFFPRILEVIVNFIPSEFDKANKDFVSQGTGIVGVKVYHKVVELPFLIRDGELEPFDVIQMDGQRAPYSRENFQKIILNLNRQIEMERESVTAGGVQSPYQTLEDYTNTTTTPGFMGDVLAIRDSQSLRRGPGMYVTAGDYDYGFEKEAKIFGIKTKKEREAELKKQQKSLTDSQNDIKKQMDDLGFEESLKQAAEYDYGFEKESKEKYNVFPFGQENRDSLEHQFEKALAKVEKEKPTMKAPKGTVEKAREEEKKAEIITDLNALLEKTANIKPMTDDEMEAIAYVLSKKAHDEFVAKLEKMASEDTSLTRKQLELIEKKASFKFTDASQMKHGDFIVFPEIDGGEVSLTPAVVLSELDDTMIEKKGQSFKFVCSIDGRIKVLNGDKFLCAKAEDRAFKLPTTGLGSLKEKDTFFALNGNKVIPPSTVNYIITPRLGEKDDFASNSVNKVATIYRCVTIDCSDIKQDVYFNNLPPRGRAIESWRKGQFVITSMEGKKFENMKYHDFLEAKSKEMGLPQETINAVMPKWDLGVEEGNNHILTTDMQTPIIKVKGVITTNFKTQEEYDTKSRLHEAGYDVEKVAFTMNQITVYCVDRKQNIFNMTVEYKDTEERFMNLRKQVFNRISKGKLKAILRILQFQGNIISEIIFKAKNEQKAQYPIPANCTMENIKEIQGGDMHNVSKEAVKGAVEKYINPLNIAKGLAIATATGLITDAAGNLAAKHPVSPNVASKLSGFSKFFSESAELSGAFEKAAQEHENEDFLDYARVLALSGHFSEKVATALNDTKNVYPSLKDVAHEIVLAKPVLEKFAYDLTALKVNQSMHKTEMVPNNVIRGAIENMDTLYKMAYGIDNAIDKDNLTFK